MTITGDDVRRTRGKESRKAFSQRVGITEAKVAAIEKGRKIKPDEMEKLLQHVSPGEGSESATPLLDRAGVTAQTSSAASNTTVTQSGQPRRTTTSGKKTKDLPEIELLQPDEGDDVYDEFDALTIMHLEPAAPEPRETARQLVPPGSRIVSNSEVQTFKRCRRKWYLAFVRGLRPKAKRYVGPLDIGTRAHSALAAWYVPEGQTKTDPRDALERVLLEDWTKIEHDVKSKAKDDDDAQVKLQSIAADFKKEADLLRAMMEGYMQWLAETGADEDLEVVAPEAPMAAPFPVESETQVFITGRLDVRLRRRSDGARLFMDHKTVGDLTSPGRVLHMNPQMKHYHLLEVLGILRDRIEAGDGIHYEVERTDGALYNMLRKVKRTVQAKPPFFERIEVRHNKHELAAYAKELRGVIEDMLRTQARIEEGYDTTVVAYPRPDESCAWQCDFFPVCPMIDDGSRAEQFISDIYEVHDPYDRYPEFT